MEDCSDSRRFATLLADFDFGPRWTEIKLNANSSPVSHALTCPFKLWARTMHSGMFAVHTVKGVNNERNQKPKTRHTRVTTEVFQ